MVTVAGFDHRHLHAICGTASTIAAFVTTISLKIHASAVPALQYSPLQVLLRALQLHVSVVSPWHAVAKYRASRGPRSDTSRAVQLDDHTHSSAPAFENAVTI